MIVSFKFFNVKAISIYYNRFLVILLSISSELE